MKNKWLSLCAVLIMYIIALAAGASFLYFARDWEVNSLLLVFISDIIATFVIFIFSLFLNNASVYDAYWSVIPPFLVIGFFYTTGATFDPALLLVLIPLLLWAIRLTYNWTREFENLKWQDWRYLQYKQQFPKIYPLINLTGIMLMPTVLVFAGCIPLYYIIIGMVDIFWAALGGIIILFATIYQTVADEQMHRFRKNPENKGKCINTGLWKYSRHPNYFAEILIWFGVFVSSITNFSILTPIGFLAILLLFIFVSIPLMEKRMLQIRSDAYVQYKTAVRSTLFPLPQKSEKLDNPS